MTVGEIRTTRGSGGRAVGHRTVNRGDGGSIPPTAVWKLRRFRSPMSLCLSEETLKAGGPFYLVSMPGEVKYHTHSGKCVTCIELTHSCWTLNALQSI